MRMSCLQSSVGLAHTQFIHFAFLSPTAADHVLECAHFVVELHRLLHVVDPEPGL